MKNCIVALKLYIESVDNFHKNCTNDVYKKILDKGTLIFKGIFLKY